MASGYSHKAGSLKMNSALEYSTRVVQEGGRRCKKSTLNDLVHLTPLRIPLMNPPSVESAQLAKVQLVRSAVQAKFPSSIKNGAGVLVYSRLQGAIAKESLVPSKVYMLLIFLADPRRNLENNALSSLY
jgi:hypothetical protein